jgi:hypothetical protein
VRRAEAAVRDTSLMLLLYLGVKVTMIQVLPAVVAPQQVMPRMRVSAGTFPQFNSVSSLEAQCKRWALAGAEASAATQAHAAMADRCVELEQQKGALSELLSQERAASSAAAAAASAAAAVLQTEIANLREQVFVTLCPRDMKHDLLQHDALAQCPAL